MVTGNLKEYASRDSFQGRNMPLLLFPWIRPFVFPNLKPATCIFPLRLFCSKETWVNRDSSRPQRFSQIGQTGISSCTNAPKQSGAAAYEMLLQGEETCPGLLLTPLSFSSHRSWRSASEWTVVSWSPSSSPSWWRWSSTCTCRSTRSCPTTDACCRPPSIGGPSGGRPPGSPSDRPLDNSIHPPVSLLTAAGDGTAGCCQAGAAHLIRLLPDTSQRGPQFASLPFLLLLRTT